ncbi:MAG TPA: glycine cleavage system protein GcvH [Gammaproteobacteria bacterium]|jgi:glycine cleavage system H protein|nr:glycine cleavage system protein GcvH [Gammaproteobacteria bacterium]
MSNTPTELKYAATHEWVRLMGDDLIEVGLTDYAQESLGDVVYVELPEVGSSVSAAQECCAVESVKAASDIYAPLSGEIIEVNLALDENPELINQGPYDKGWMFRIRCADVSDLDRLLSSDSYVETLSD